MQKLRKAFAFSCYLPLHVTRFRALTWGQNVARVNCDLRHKMNVMYSGQVATVAHRSRVLHAVHPLASQSSVHCYESVIRVVSPSQAMRQVVLEAWDAHVLPRHCCLRVRQSCRLAKLLRHAEYQLHYPRVHLWQRCHPPIHLAILLFLQPLEMPCCVRASGSTRIGGEDW